MGVKEKACAQKRVNCSELPLPMQTLEWRFGGFCKTDSSRDQNHGSPYSKYPRCLGYDVNLLKKGSVFPMESSFFSTA